MTAEVAAEAQDEPVYCICRGPEAGFMVFCDGCEEWFHGDCVGIKKRQADKLDKYLCPNCAPPVEKNAKPSTPDSEQSKSRSGRSIRKKKWDEEEYEYDFKNGKEEDEDYEDEEEDERPQRPAPKRMAPQPHPQQHIQRPLHVQHAQHPQHPQHLQQHLQHPQHPQHSQHQIPSQQIPSYMSHNNHFTHPNHLNLMGQHPLAAHPISNHLNINPTIQAINSINHYLHAPAPLGNPNPNPILPHPINAPTSLSGIQGASPGSKRSFASTTQQPQQGPPKASPEPKPKMVRRESFPPGGKGDKKEKEKEKEKDPVKEKEAEETVRRNARNNLSEALGNPMIAIAIEAEMFKQFPIKDKSKEYTAKARSLLFNLRDPKNATLKERTLSGAITPQRFVSMRPEEYASGELAEWRRQQEAKAMQSVSILPEEDEQAQAQKLNEIVQRQMEAEQKAADGNGTPGVAPAKPEDVGKYLSRDGEEEDSVKKEKESVDIDINIADNPNLAAPLALPLPLPIPTPGAAASLPLPPLPSANAAAATTSATSTSLITPLPPSVSVPIWKGEFDKIAVGVEPFSVRGYHIGGPHVDTLLSRVTSVTARGKLEVAKLSDYITEKIDSSPHRTRSLVLIEPAGTNDDEAYEMTWEYCQNNRSPAVVCGITPPVPEDEESTVPRLDQMYIVPLTTPEEIPDFLFPPNMTSSARKINLRAAGQRSSTRACYMLAIVVTKLPDTNPKKSKPETPSRADSPNPNAPLLPTPISPSSSMNSMNPMNPMNTMNPIFNSPPHTQQPQQAQQQAQQQQQMYNMQQQAQYGNQGSNYNLPSPSQMYQNNMYQQQNPNFSQFQNSFQQQQQFNNNQPFPPHQPLPPPIFNTGNPQFFNSQYNNFQQQNFNKP